MSSCQATVAIVHANLALHMLQGISTAIWLDRIAAIQGGAANGGRLGLTQHFDAAAKQAAAAKKPVVVQIVVYDLPSRWLCSADGLGVMSPPACCVCGGAASFDLPLPLCRYFIAKQPPARSHSSC